LRNGVEVEQMMKVVGEEGTSLEDYIVYLKGDFLDAVYLQQNSFDPVDDSVSVERQKHSFAIILRILGSAFGFAGKDEARSWFNRARQLLIDWNSSEWQSAEFTKTEAELRAAIDSAAVSLAAEAESHIRRVSSPKGAN
jgi:V/A-type H+-transporting ATPase subunit A